MLLFPVEKAKIRGVTLFNCSFGNRMGHWMRRSSNIKSYITSAAVDGIVNQTPEVLFMT
jgi:hypothetical protein